MSSSDDIANLFRQFGGQPAEYQEMGRDNGALQARGRWPLLASLEIGGPAEPIPPVVATPAAAAVRPASKLFDMPLQTPSAAAPALRTAPVQAPPSTSMTVPADLPAAAPPPQRLPVDGADAGRAPISLRPPFPSSAPVPATTAFPRRAPASSTPAPASLPAGAGRRNNDLATVFQRLHSVPEQRRSETAARAAGDVLLRKLLRS